MPPLPTITRIHPASSPEAVEALIEMLCLAFDQDAHINWIVRQDRKRLDAFRRLFHLLLFDLLGSRGELYATSDLGAAAICFPPGVKSLSLVAQARMGLRFAKVTGWQYLPLRAYGLNRMEMRHPKPHHYFLQTIGVHPAMQRLGYGSALLKHVLAPCDASGIHAYLETSSESNVVFYARHGFKVISETNLPYGPKLWQMLREPVQDGDRD